MKKLLCLLLAAVATFGAEYDSAGYVPTSAATVTASTVRLYYIVLSNDTGSAITVTIADRTANCGGGTCKPWPAISVAANSSVAFPMYGRPFTSGFTVVASASGVNAWITYN